MSAAAIKAFGIITFVFEAVIFLILIGPRRQRLGPLPSRAMIPLFIFFCSLTLVGLGLLFLRKWAAVLFSSALVAFPTKMTLDSIGEAPLGFYLMILAFAIVLMLPIIIVIRSWPLLSWRGKWFL